MNLQLISSQNSFGGALQRIRHRSESNQCDMIFSIFLPPQVSAGENVPVLYWLSGLTCNDENFMQKAGAQRIAAELGIAIVTPDTSPRGDEVPDDPDGAYDMGLGAGFYVDATQQPWAKNYQMYSYISKELPALIQAHFAVTDRAAICGHSMGGHGALMIALKNADNYVSVSAFSPIVSPMLCPWGDKALSHYLGNDRTQWAAYDSCLLLDQAEIQLPMLIDQGTSDEFLAAQLKTELLTARLDAMAYPATIRMQQGYDHSYYFIATFIEDHLRFHAKYLAGE